MQNSLKYVTRHWGKGLNHWKVCNINQVWKRKICGCHHFSDDFSVFGRVISQPLRIFVNAAACWTGHSSTVYHGMAGWRCSLLEPIRKVVTPHLEERPERVVYILPLLAWSKTRDIKHVMISMFGHCSHFEGLNVYLRFVKTQHHMGWLYVKFAPESHCWKESSCRVLVKTCQNNGSRSLDFP